MVIAMVIMLHHSGFEPLLRTGSLGLCGHRDGRQNDKG